jgi:valyl-tRNA synthetase
MKPLPQNYNHKEAEKKWQEFWLSSGVYNWNENSTRADNFVIDTPPPTVSGLLHMGHIFSYTQADFIARYKRMKGYNVFYPMGFDDNGLPTERLVEKVKKVRAVDYIKEHGREGFVALCNDVVEEARVEFRTLFRSAALSVDWNQEYHTISDEVQKISQMSFLDLYKKNHVERVLQPMFWDPIDQTAIANAEIEEKELDSFENYIWFGLITDEQLQAHKEGKKIEWEDLEKVEVMTTRPELLPACMGLMIHPDDINKYSGKKAVSPYFNAIVPIVADDKVFKEKGTGVVMCCSFGDETDIFWWKKHKEFLHTKIIINKFGKIDFSLPYTVYVASFSVNYSLQKNESPIHEHFLEYESFVGKFMNLNGLRADHQDKKLSAKHKMIELLEANNLTAKEKKPIKHMVKCAERSGAALEFIPTTQWFVKLVDKKEQLLAKARECTWYPDYMLKRLEQWIESLSWDWCISRQRYFGVPFPVWYSKRAGEEGKILFADVDQLPVNPIKDLPKGYSKDEVEPDFDVMDTWATSSISPQINSHAINKDFAINYDRHQKLFPADIRPQAHEIIRTWAFYTIAKAMLHEDEIPWKNLMISGWCLASDKTKMSKSKGNVITPVDLIENHSADAVRYWSSTSRLGADTAFSEETLKIGKKLVNKLWNATKFAAINFDKLNSFQLPASGNQQVAGSGQQAAAELSSAKFAITSGKITNTLDKWIISRLAKAVKRATEDFELYEYSAARAVIEDFFWNDFCDNYLEMIKVRAYDETGANPEGQQSAILAVYHSVEAILRLFAPIVPHICDELYTHIFDDKLAAKNITSIHAKGTWPQVDDYVIDEESEKSGEYARKILDEVRKTKADANVSIKFPIENLIVSVPAAETKYIEAVASDIANVTSAKNFKIIEGEFNVTTELAKEAAA